MNKSQASQSKLEVSSNCKSKLPQQNYILNRKQRKRRRKKYSTQHCIRNQRKCYPYEINKIYQHPPFLHSDSNIGTNYLHFVALLATWAAHRCRPPCPWSSSVCQWVLFLLNSKIKSKKRLHQREFRPAKSSSSQPVVIKALKPTSLTSGTFPRSLKLPEGMTPTVGYSSPTVEATEPQEQLTNAPSFFSSSLSRQGMCLARSEGHDALLARQYLLDHFLL